MLNLPNNLIKSKILCASTLLSMIDVSAFNRQISTVMFTVFLSDEHPTEVSCTISNGILEIHGNFKHSELKDICKKLDESSTFFVNNLSKWEQVGNSWEEDRQVMVLTPQVPNISKEVTEVIEQVSEVNATLEDTEILVSGISEDISINPQMKVLIALRNTEDLLIKKEIGLKADELLPLLDAWLLATGQKKAFIESIKAKKHNSLVLYLYPALEWYVQSVERDKEVTFETIFLNHVTPICKKLSAERKEKVTPTSVVLLEYLRKTETPKDYSFYAQVQLSIINGTNYKNSTRLIKKTSSQLRKREDKSERVSEIRNRTNAIIQRSGKEAIPVLDSIFHISPIQTKDEQGNIFLTQTFLKRIDTTWIQTYRNIAWFTEGALLYYSDFDEKNKEELALRNKHGIKKPIIADGINTFPDLSIRKIALESLVPSTGNLWVTETGYRIFDRTGQPVSKQETEKVFFAVRQAELHNLTVDLSKYECDEKGNLRRQEMQSQAAISFEGFSHPNLAVKSPKPHVKTERKAPKPIKLDGAKSAPGSFELKAVVGKTPMLLTLEPNGTQWDLIALPLRVPPYHLSIYLSDKLNKTDLVSHIRKEIEFLSKQLSLIVTSIKLESDQLTLLENLLSLILSGDRKSVV